ncbi:MAG: M28 family peptidase [Bacteroidota bacterium]|nr:M28 family peptidase [Bacteroidota bacterium]
MPSIKYFLFILCLFAWFCVYNVNAQTDSLKIRMIVNEELLNGKCYERLDYLSNKIGGRLSGSPQAARAVEWAVQTLKNEGFDSVWLQPVMVPHWVRGEKEEAWFMNGSGKTAVHICALGNAIATSKNGLMANIIEVKDFAELHKLGRDKINGKIVFFNRPMNPLYIRTFEAYRDAVNQRSSGAIEAANLGALGVVVRSMASNIDIYPHTGAMRFLDSVVKIPACAISTYDAEVLSRELKQNPNLSFYFKQSCEMLPEVLSYNVIAQINGSEKPDEIILVGGHLDSWDNGDGAHDDGAGCVQSMEVLHLFKTLGIKPRRSIRCVLFINEENGLRGGEKYAELAGQNKEKHVAAIESDAGGFTPRSFGVSCDSIQMLKLKSWEMLFKPYGIQEFAEGGGGADIGPLKKQNIVLIGFGPDSQRYFDLHHSETDTFDKVSKRELELGAANIAVLVWLLSQYGL